MCIKIKRKESYEINVIHPKKVMAVFTPLYQKLVKNKSSEIHQKIEVKDTDCTLVMSIYENQRPSHEVLDNLFLWAITHNKVDLIEKIIEFAMPHEKVRGADNGWCNSNSVLPPM
ncbi:hypothetical protein CEJ87_15235 [Caldifermentibacillus hisashii]|nr:hypothetical protein CEJ87_15235 [Caldifermentibacillus hisashii]